MKTSLVVPDNEIVEENTEILQFLEVEKIASLYEKELEVDSGNSFWTLYEEHVRPFDTDNCYQDIDVDVQVGWYPEYRNPID